MTESLLNNSQPPAQNVTALGAALTALARTAEDRDCLEVFAELLNLENDETCPHLLTVLVQPTGGAQILTVAHAGPGLTLQVTEDLEMELVQLWNGKAGV